MYKYRYYNLDDPYDHWNLEIALFEPWQAGDEPYEYIRVITAEYANVFAEITAFEMKLRARLREIEKTLRSRNGWDTKRNNEYIDAIERIIEHITGSTKSLAESDFNIYAHSLHEVLNGKGWWTHEEYLNSVRGFIKDAEGELRGVVDAYNEIEEEANELLARSLNTRKRTWV